MASHGYIVVGSDAPHSTSVVVMPDGRVIHKTAAGNPNDAPVSAEERERLAEALISIWSSDTSFEVDQLVSLNADDPSGRFTGWLDLSAIGVAGHSIGAPYGSVVRDGLEQPFLFLLSDHGDSLNSTDRAIYENIRAVVNRIPGDRLIVTLRGAHHFSFSDQALVKSQIVMKVLGGLGVTGGLDPRTGLVATTRYAREFFDIHLRGSPRALFYNAPLVPEARFESR